MANLNEQIEKTASIFSDIKSALEERGIDTTNLSPKDYADAVREIVNDVNIENVGLIPVLIFTYNKSRPSTPVGGNWNPITNEMTIPDGWYTDIEEQFDVSDRLLPLWMSSAVFASTGDLYKRWTTPVRISGQNGEDGKNGEPGTPGIVAGVTQYFNKPIFYRGTRVRPETPIVTYDPINNELSLPSGWSTLVGEENEGDVYWQSYVSYNTANVPAPTCTTPVRLTAESSTIRGNIRWYQLSNSPAFPAKGTSSWKEWSENFDIAPTASEPYLYCYDETIYSEANRSSSPVYLLCTYVKGLKDIDITYTVGSSEEVISADDYPTEFWYEKSSDAISADKSNRKEHPDDTSKNGYYPGLNEDTLLLWCRERFEYLDPSQNEDSYRIISYYKAAEKAPVLYSAGVYNDGIHYERNEEQCPYVFYPKGLYLDDYGQVITVTDEETGETRPAVEEDGVLGTRYQYFFLKNSYETGAEHQYESFYDAYVDERWRKIDSFEAIYSDIGIFKAALVGKFVFDDKYLFSQFGKGRVQNTDGTWTNWKVKDSYENYTDTEGSVMENWITGEKKKRVGVAAAIEDETANKKYVPGALINAVTGESWFGNGTTKFYSDGEGDLADGAIGWRFENGSDEPTLYIDGGVKIGKRAPAHVEGDSTVPEESSKSFEEVITDWYDKQNAISLQIEKLEDGFETTVADLNEKLDGKVEYWFYDYDPTEENYPLKNWIELNVELDHQGDIFVNKANETVWIFGDTNDDGTVNLIWNEVTEEADKELYLELAFSAGAVDGNVTTYVGDEDPSSKWSESQYRLHEGDLWFNGQTIKVWQNIDDVWGWQSYLNHATNEDLENATAAIISDFEDLAARTDKMIRSYFGDSWPGDSEFKPASDETWNFTEGDFHNYENHIGDTYTNTLSYDSTISYSNKSWRFEDYNSDLDKDGYYVSIISNGSTKEYGWVEIKDANTLTALEAAQNAQAAADGKTTTFIGNPDDNPNWDAHEGDIAVDGTVIYVYENSEWNTVYSLAEINESVKTQLDATILNYFIYDDDTDDVTQCITWIKNQSWYESNYDNHIEDTITIIQTSTTSDYPSYRIVAKEDSNPKVEQITDAKKLANLTQAAHSQEAIDGQIKTVYATTELPDAKDYNNGDICILEIDGKTSTHILKGGVWTSTTSGLQQELTEGFKGVETKIETIQYSIDEWNTAHDGMINQYFDYVDVSEWTGNDGWVDDPDDEDDTFDINDYQTWSKLEDGTYKRAHVGDTYTKRTDGLDTSWVYEIDTTENGVCTYKWTEITDSKTQQALDDAANAQASADGKIRNFVDTPNPPYSVGDTWTQGSDGGLMVCIKDKDADDQYEQDDWTAATNYVDKTAIETSISDYDKVNNIFSDVFENEGATLSKYIGVTDESDKIVGALNGSDTWNHDTYGKLIFSAGMDGIDNMKEANVRIYADGTAILGGGNHTFYQDGSGFVAKNNFSWDSDGNISIGQEASKLNVDGSGYFANGLFGWNSEGDVHFGKEEDPGIVITSDGQIQFGENISIGTDTTLKSLLTLASMWRLEGSSGNYYIQSTYPVKIDGDLTVSGNACATGQVAAGGVADSSGDEHSCLGSIELDVVSLMSVNEISQVVANNYGLTTNVINNLLLGRYTKVLYNDEYTKVYEYSAIKTSDGDIQITLTSGNLAGDSYTTIELYWNGSTWTGTSIEL